MIRLISLAFLLPIYAVAKCEVVDTKYIYKGKEVVKKEKICFLSNSSIVVSKNCFKKKCEAFRAAKKRGLEKLYGPFGNPLFKLCHHFGGRPQIYKYYHSMKWNKTSRCLFEKDGSFIDNSLYLELNNKTLNKSSNSEIFDLLNQ